jgi:hypothetical protein
MFGRRRAPEPEPPARSPRPKIHAGPGQRWRPLSLALGGSHNAAMAEKPPHIPAAAAMLAEQFHDREFGFSGGMMLAPPAPMPQPAPTGLVIPPPDWTEQTTSAPAAPPVPLGSALGEITADGGEEFPEWPLHVETNAPLVRPVPPPPDWRLEETLRVEEQLVEVESPGARLERPAPKGLGATAA